MVICYLFAKLPRLSATFYTSLMYAVMVMVSAIIIAGFVRIVIEMRFRKALANNNNMMKW